MQSSTFFESSMAIDSLLVADFPLPPIRFLRMSKPEPIPPHLSSTCDVIAMITGLCFGQGLILVYEMDCIICRATVMYAAVRSLLDKNFDEEEIWRFEEAMMFGN
ncbi:hypothetical protein RYX36_000068 [Vicia faba]